ncbi:MULTISPECIES: hypothetical protein [Streptomyces]|uniref:Uncharacterized protein n=2 Tax=Streptomyces TaxID=1883 RepID=A0A100Y7C2_9ACTN|nr:MULTISPECIES: hypothetical protein [Streptomyces]KUH39015.1 hypothetical protein ATE80_09345 [Streptomyces kanasensis]UUS34576.1 hypothetical protein NRO40_29655 [Streptomyces changanensis]
MDEHLAALAASAAAAMVSAVATDAWERTRAGIVHLWSRYRPAASDEQVAAELDRTRARLLSDERPAAPDPELVTTWEARFRYLLMVEPAAAQALERLVAESAESAESVRAAAVAEPSGPAVPEENGGDEYADADARPAGDGGSTHVEMRGEARDQGQVFQSGHTLNVRFR